MNRTWVGMGVGAACMVGIACGADGEMAAEMLDDAGRLLVDAGRAVADAGAQLVDAGDNVDGSAVAQPGGNGETHEVQCTDAYVRTVKQGSTTTRTVARVAELATPTGDITGVDVIVCGREGPGYEPPCPSGATCSGSYLAPSYDCSSSSVDISPGKVRAYCGTFSEVGGALQPSNVRWRTARITIRR